MKTGRRGRGLGERDYLLGLGASAPEQEMMETFEYLGRVRW